jgi:hypothetical protein
MQLTKKYQISQFPALQGVGLELDTNNWYSIRTTQKLRIA